MSETVGMTLLSLFRSLLPHQRTTHERAREALLSCGIDPDEIAWHVGEDGSFSFGRKHPDAEGLSYEKTTHILAWARRNRLKVRFIGWEQKRP